MMTEQSDAGRKAQADSDIGEIPTIDCRTADEMFAPYLAHDLSRIRRDTLIRHIRSCADCHDRLFALEFALEVAAREVDDEEGENAPDRPSSMS